MATKVVIYALLFSCVSSTFIPLAPTIPNRVSPIGGIHSNTLVPSVQVRPHRILLPPHSVPRHSDSEQSAPLKPDESDSIAKPQRAESSPFNTLSKKEREEKLKSCIYSPSTHFTTPVTWPPHLQFVIRKTGVRGYLNKNVILPAVKKAEPKIQESFKYAFDVLKLKVILWFPQFMRDLIAQLLGVKDIPAPKHLKENGEMNLIDRFFVFWETIAMNIKKKLKDIVTVAWSKMTMEFVQSAQKGMFKSLAFKKNVVEGSEEYWKEIEELKNEKLWKRASDDAVDFGSQAELETEKGIEVQDNGNVWECFIARGVNGASTTLASQFATLASHVTSQISNIISAEFDTQLGTSFATSASSSVISASEEDQQIDQIRLPLIKATEQQWQSALKEGEMHVIQTTEDELRKEMTAALNAEGVHANL
ncbi:hypothetical protein BKA69DRAFT_1125815 [Paraphysoderma sedebokerense]|nr:hypothetical protein BKA69DRAFT_1125815 [Paraphysoderma sedebokerense]